ncbi:hypothetical protein E1B28_001369 [Marasmius oreades]|uniref:MCM N-terminal domain-containing protein n=1 Tax=Marasmius oreades TaxID=181124 RepID=A0A9P7V3F6_9AGAR|nr:uncharacterized protein E1B28_001369 [Marasmius oreades]KAG7099528.1 hypothetical protein E1B28_001369 [Marasmius oreades]
MSGYEANNVYFVTTQNPSDPVAPESPAEIESFLLDFILQYRVGEEFLYRDKLRGNLLLKEHVLEIDLRHVGLYNEELAYAIQERPTEILPLARLKRYFNLWV